MSDKFNSDLDYIFSKHVLINNYFYELNIYLIKTWDLLPVITYENT